MDGRVLRVFVPISLFLLAPLAAAGGHSSGTRSREVEIPRKPAIACADWTLTEWTDFFRTKVRNILSWSDRQNTFVADLASTYPEMTSCSASLNRAGLAQCTTRLKEFLTAYADSFGPGHSMGMNLKDADYLAAIPPGIMDIPPELSANGFPRNWQEVVKRKRWDFIMNENEGNSGGVRHQRFFIRIKYETYDQYYNIGPNQEADAYPFIIDQITVVHKAASGAPLERPKVYFKESMTAGFERPIVPGHPGRCLGCHTSGPREIFTSFRESGNWDPAQYYGFLGDEPNPPPTNTKRHFAQVLANFNETLANYPPVSWDGYYAQDALGPAAKTRIAGVTSCASCHDSLENFGRGPINLGSRWGNELSVYGKIMSREMPPGIPENQTTNVYRTLKAEYPSQFQTWLGLNACPQPTAN